MVDEAKLRLDTKLISFGGSLGSWYCGCFSFPIYSCSTIKFDTFAKYESATKGVDCYHGVEDSDGFFEYGRRYNPTVYELSTLLARFECDNDKTADRASVLLFPSGVMALSLVLEALCAPGSVIMVSQDAYKPTRTFAEKILAKFGVKIVFYSDVKQLEELIEKNTRVIFCESPSSLLFRFYDLREIVRIARKYNITSVVDNSWATFVGCKPLEMGIDVVVYSATKYISGHSDVVMGAMACSNIDLFRRIQRAYFLYGVCVSAHDCSLVQRGLRTLAVRFKQNQYNALKVVDYLASREEVDCILYPTTLSSNQCSLWCRDYSVSGGLMGVILKPYYSKADIVKVIDSMKVFNLGLSWGGCCSMILLNDISDIKHLLCDDSEESSDICLRLFCGLEDYTDLINDLRQAFDLL